MEEDVTQMEGSHVARRCVCVCVLGSPNDRLIYAYQQRARWEAYIWFLQGGGITVYR